MSWNEYKKYREELEKKGKKEIVNTPTVGPVKNPVSKYKKDYSESLVSQKKDTTNRENIRLVSKNETKDSKTYTPLWYKIKTIAQNNNIVKKSQAFDDGYQFGDITKSVGSTVGNVGTSIWQGMHNISSGTGKLLAGGVAQVADWTGHDEYANRVRKNITEETPLDKLVRESNEKVNKNSVLGQTTENALQGVGTVAGTVALQSVGVPWQATIGASTVGNELSEAYKNNATNAEAWLSAGISAGVEVGSEYIFSGVKLPGTGKTTEALIDGATDKIKNNVMKNLTKFGINSLGEGAEEVISGIGSAIGKKLTYMSDKELEEIYSKEDALNDFVTGTMSSVLSGGAQRIMENNRTKYKDYYTGKTADNNTQKWLNEAQKIIDKNNTSNLQQNNTINQNNIAEQQIIQENNKNAQNGISEQINNIPKVTIKDFNESAKQYNIDYNNEDLKEINQMYKKRGITAYFDKNTFNNNNDAFSVWKPTYDEQGNISGREVVFNPNAQDTNVRVQELAVHELGHDLDLNEVQDMILKDASRKENWDSARKSLENTYRQAYEKDGINISEEDFNKIVDEEATMSILQRELGNQEYVNRLVNQNQSIAKKIYNWVIDKLNKFTGGKNEKIFWADVKNKFETAYNQEFNKNESNLKYSVIYNKDGSFNRVKINDNIFENTNNKSISKTIYNYLTEHINEYADIIESGQRVYLGKDLPGEYTYSKSAQSLPLPQKMAKGRAVTELKEIINNATNREYSNYKKQKHVNDAKYGFYKYDTKFSFEQNGKEQVYTGTILIRNDANGKKYLYDILNIKKIGSNLPPVASNSQKSSAKNGGSNNLPNNSLPSTQQNVNSKPLQKYSMQESENNSGSFNLQKKTFDVSGNENLANAKTLFYRTREDGQYYVQATDGSGKITYDGVFYGEKQLARSFGGEIAEKIVNTSESTNNEIYLQSDNIKGETDYMMAHRPTKTGAYASNITKGTGEWDSLMPEDVYEHPEWYFDMNQEYSKESFEVLKRIKNNPNAEIKIYRATTGNKINEGDWVTLSKKYAEYHNNSQFNGKGNIVELNVKAKDVQYAGDDVNEFGYFPQSDNQKYALPTKEWKRFVEDNYQKQGTGKDLKEYNLPIKKPTTPPQRQESDANNLQKYNNYKQNILKRRAEEVNSLISYKNEAIRNIESKINEKQTLLNSKKNQNTKVVANIKSQIERLKSQQTKIENLYNEKIDKVNKKTNKEKIDFETRNTMKQLARENLRAEIAPLTEDLSKFKDKKKGILYKREIAQRNIEDVVQDKELSQAINDTIFNPVQKHQAEKTREINNLFRTINDLKLDKRKIYDYVPKETRKAIKIDEATLAQLLIEKKLTKEDLKNEYKMSKEQVKKVEKTANTFSEILDYLYNKMNEEQIKFGYAPIGKIKNYFPHFFENKPDTMLGKIASYFGIDTTNQDLPTEIAGKTDTFKPGKTWNSNTLQRKTNKTDYDALKAMEKYIVGASDIIYTTEDIQRVREFEREIRYKYSDKGIQEQVDKIYNDNNLTQDAKECAVKSILENTESELSNFVTWLNDYANVLANKKSFSDRSMERDLGRNMYSTMKGIEGRIASNTIGGNLSVSLTNFAPLFQAMGTTKFNYVLTGALQTTLNDIKGIVGKKDIDFVNNSTFLTNRFGTDTISKQTITQNISNVASVPMNIIDAFTSESIVRAKYLENLDNGMTEEQALDNADKYASRLMADRSKGALPILFNSKNPLSKLVTMFQVEPNNIVSNYLKDMPKNANGKIDLTYQATKLMVASWAFNTIVMAVRGGNEVLPDPIRWVSYLMKYILGDDEEEKEKAKKDLAESIIGSIPFASNIAGFGLNDLLGLDSDVGRIPIANAIPSITNVVKALDKEADSEYRKELLTKELMKPFIYLGLPTGGAQLKKTVEGISTVYNGGSYKTDKDGNKKLQFPVENATIKDYIQAGIFGKYSLPVAKQYTDRGFKTLSSKQTKTYEDANLPYKEYIEYLNAGLKTTQDKINYINSKDMSIEQKWGIYKNDIFSSDERKDGGSQLKDSEYITSNGVSKEKYIKIYNSAKKNNIDMPTETEYKDLKKQGISLENYMDYKTQIKNKTKQKQKDEKDEDAQLTDKEKMGILLESNYSNKEKTALYESQILSSQDTTYEIYKMIGMNINDYMKYKQQEFVSDKKDDGTLSGKSVSGSRKKKFYKWLTSKNMPNTTYEQRLILAGMEYKLQSFERDAEYKYIKSLNLTQKQQEQIFSKLKGFKVYKNGKVTW